jgi:hypothetical protein
LIEGSVIGQLASSISGSRVASRLADAFLAAEFAAITAFVLASTQTKWWGADARIYHRALELWLSGANPYDAAVDGIGFAAPPLTLIPLVPFAVLPEDLFVVLMAATNLVVVAWIVRRLKLPVYWVLFPPVVEGIVVGNLNLIVLGLLLVSAGPVAALLKVYAVLPMAGMARYRAIAITIVVLIATFPILPWATYIDDNVLDRLASQANPGLSAWGNPAAMGLSILALGVLGRRRSSWLVVPALWPSTQFHYYVMALPGIDRLIGAFMALPLPGAAPAAVMSGAVLSVVARRRRAIRDRETISRNSGAGDH